MMINNLLNNNLEHVIPKVAQQRFHLAPLQMTAPQEAEVFFVVDHDHVSLSQVQTVKCQSTLNNHGTTHSFCSTGLIFRSKSRLDQVPGKRTFRNYCRRFLR